MEVTEDLLPSMLEHGQQTPGTVAVLTPSKAKQYVLEINEIFGVSHDPDELVPVRYENKQRRFILVAGHRRHETCLLINRLVAEKKCGFSAAYNGEYRAELRFGLTTAEAIALQFNENRHVQVPPHEEAYAAWGFWIWLRKQNAELTPQEFARIIGRTPEWVRNALRFCSLPRSVQLYVDGRDDMPKLPYRILVEVARLAEGYEHVVKKPLTEEAHHLWLRRAILGRLDAVRFGKMVSEYLADKRREANDQKSLFGDGDILEDTRPTRRIVAPHLIKDIWRWLEYMRVLAQIHHRGQFGGESFLGPESDQKIRESYSPGSPLALLRRASEIHVDLLPHMIELAKREGGRHRRALKGHVQDVESVHQLIKALAEFESKLRQ